MCGWRHKILCPGVQHTQEADLRAQMLWIGGDLAQRLRRRSEQHIVDNGLVLEGDDLDLLGHREHDVEVGHVERFGLTVREPLGARETLALWATFVAARIVRDALMATIAACLDVTAKSGGAATLDRDHGAPPRGGQRRAILITESRAEVAEYVRHFQPLVGHEPTRQAGTRSGTVGTSTSSDSSGLAVAQTLLVAIMRYCAVVLRLRWRSSSRIVRRSVAASSRCTANAWRTECGETRSPKPQCRRTCRQVKAIR